MKKILETIKKVLTILTSEENPLDADMILELSMNAEII